MNVLVVAHPDDEVLWFDPTQYDKIVICFTERSDAPGMGDRRRQAIGQHPLSARIKCLDVPEGDVPNLQKRLLDASGDWTSVTTHGAHGEYGHIHHKQVFKACMDLLNCPVNGMDPSLYREIRSVYQKHGCWTWDT